MNKYIFKPYIDKSEINSVGEVLKKKDISIYSNDSVFRFEKEFSKITDNKYSVATNTGTAALHTILLSLNIKNGDEVIVQCMNYISVIYSIMYCDGKPVFSDIDSQTFTMEWEQIKPLITKKTKAIITSSLFGLSPNIIKIVKEAKKRNILVVEDLSQSYGLLENNKPYRVHGDAGFYSFSEPKNITTSEGGMIVTNNKNILNESRKIIDLGQIYMDSDLPVYPSCDFTKNIDHKIIGFTYRMSPILAVIGIEQLMKTKKIVSKRDRISNIYKNVINDCKEISIPIENKGFKICYNTFVVKFKDKELLSRVKKQLEKNDLPIMKPYYGEIMCYSIFSQYVDKAKLPNTKEFDESSLVIPILANLSLTTNKNLIREFINIIKECQQ